MEDAKREWTSSFLVHHPLRRLKANQGQTLEPSSLPSQFSIWVGKGTEDGWMPTTFRACITKSPTWLLSFPWSGSRLYVQNLSGGRTCYFMDSLDTSLFLGNGSSMCSLVLDNTWRTVYFIKQCAFLYSYNHDVHVLHAFCEDWCRTTNTPHTMSEGISIFLSDLYRLGDLPISGKIHAETVPCV